MNFVTKCIFVLLRLDKFSITFQSLVILKKGRTNSKSCPSIKGDFNMKFQCTLIFTTILQIVTFYNLFLYTVVISDKQASLLATQHPGSINGIDLLLAEPKMANGVRRPRTFCNILVLCVVCQRCLLDSGKSEVSPFRKVNENPSAVACIV